MAVLSFVSASGAPGVTATVVGLALVWHRPALVVDADPGGASAPVAGFLGGQLIPPANLLTLVPDGSSPRLAAAVLDASIPVANTSMSLLAGIDSPVQARAVAGLWEPLLGVFQGLEQRDHDVLIDAGRLGMAWSAGPVIRGADMIVLVARSSLTAVNGARAGLAGMVREFGDVHDRLRLLVVGDRRPYAASEIATQLGVPLLGVVEWEPEQALVLSDGTPARRHFERSRLMMSLRAIASQLQTELVQPAQVMTGGGEHGAA